MADNDEQSEIPADGDPNPAGPHDSLGKFGLNEPTGQFTDLAARIKAEGDVADSPDGHPLDSGEDGGAEDPNEDVKYKNMGWKGIDDIDDDDEEEPPLFTKKEPIPEDELDMTPMVDVTFLLLIFFMVTASFTLQKSLEQPHATDDQASTRPPEEITTPEDYVEVLVDQTNTYYVTSRSESEVECPSASEMRSRVRNAFENEGAVRMVIKAHVESLHSKVVTAWDAGVLNNASEIQMNVTEEDY